MADILTITFNPAIDKNSTVQTLIPGKKLKCSFPKTEPGGGGINVARAIRKLGGIATAMFPAGGCTGDILQQLLVTEKVPFNVIKTESETRENLMILETSTNKQYRFGMPGSPLKENEWQEMLQRVNEMDACKFIVASGSLPPGVPTNIFARIAIIANEKQSRLIVDTSGEALKEAVAGGVFLLKPNLGELSSLVGNSYLSPEEIVDAARQVLAGGKCEVIVVSMGQQGAILVTKDLFRRFSSPVVNVKSTVGAGDSMVAGIVHALGMGKTIEDAARYGIACGTAATMNPGTELCRLTDVENLFGASLLRQ